MKLYNGFNTDFMIVDGLLMLAVPCLDDGPC